MTTFDQHEPRFRRNPRPAQLGRIATVAADGLPHVVPVGSRLTTDESEIEIGGLDLTRSKKFKDVSRAARLPSSSTS